MTPPNNPAETRGPAEVLNDEFRTWRRPGFGVFVRSFAIRVGGGWLLEWLRVLGSTMRGGLAASLRFGSEVGFRWSN